MMSHNGPGLEYPGRGQEARKRPPGLEHPGDLRTEGGQEARWRPGPLDWNIRGASQQPWTGTFGAWPGTKMAALGLEHPGGRKDKKRRPLDWNIRGDADKRPGLEHPGRKPIIWNGTRRRSEKR